MRPGKELDVSGATAVRPASMGVTGTAVARGSELVLRLHPDVTHPAPPAMPCGFGFLRHVGPLVGQARVEHFRIIDWCARHPILARLRGWTR